jgi:hypothetical protein
LLLVFWCTSAAQLGSFSGDIRYEHRYQDYEYGGNLTKLVIKNPTVNLRLRGSILSPRLLNYSLYSSLNLYFVSTENAFFSYSSQQFSWNKYNFIANLFSYSPVRLTLAARENAYELKSGETIGTSTDRLQQQRAEISVNQVPWLPTLSLAYTRDRTYSYSGLPYDVVNQTLTFTATGATDTAGSYGLTATMSDLRDQYAGTVDRFVTMQFSASRALSARHGIELSADYEKYTGYSVLSASLSYAGTLADRLRVRSGLSASSVVSAYAQSRAVSLSQSASYRLSESLQCGVGVSGYVNNSTYEAAAGRRETYGSWATSGNLQHRRSVAGLSMTNAFSAGYSEQRFGSRFNSFHSGLSNTLARTVGLFALTASHDLSYLRVRNGASYDVIDNSGTLVASGQLARQIRSQTDLRYRDTRYPGEETAYRDQRAIYFTQRCDGSFVYAIPFTLALSGSANWYLSGIRGHTYGWSLSFVSTSFFVRGLVVTYMYTRTYDPYYEREVPEHSGSIAYVWRAISVSARFRKATFPVQVRELQFIISRPF